MEFRAHSHTEAGDEIQYVAPTPWLVGLRISAEETRKLWSEGWGQTAAWLPSWQEWASGNKKTHLPTNLIVCPAVRSASSSSCRGGADGVERSLAREQNATVTLYVSRSGRHLPVENPQTSV